MHMGYGLAITSFLYANYNTVPVNPCNSFGYGPITGMLARL
jgi:hypothetical protein